MTDKEWEAKMLECHAKLQEHFKLLEEITEEYEQRYGASPSDIDDDYFIDTFHYGTGKVSLKDVKKHAERRIKQKGD